MVVVRMPVVVVVAVCRIEGERGIFVGAGAGDDRHRAMLECRHVAGRADHPQRQKQRQQRGAYGTA